MNVPKKLFEFDNKGWDINCQQLPTPERGVYPYHYIRDKLVESEDKKYACLFYTITEYRMGAESGLIAIYQNKDAPILKVNPKDQWFDYSGSNSVVFFDDMLFVRKLAYNLDEQLSGTPFVIFDFRKNIFGFIDFDWSSIYYSLIKVSENTFKFFYDKQSGNNKVIPSRHNEVFKLEGMKFYPMDQSNDLLKLYFEEKNNLVGF